VGQLSDIVVTLEEGVAPAPLPPGALLPGRLPPDPAALMSQAGQAIERLSAATTRADEALVRVVPHLEAAAGVLGRVAARIDHGPGLLHDLVFDTRLTSSVRQALGRAADAERRLDAALSHLEGAAAGVEAVVAHVRSGQGTLGGLVYDPAIYDNVRTIVGGIRRSTILRALVRYAISRQERASPEPPVTSPQRVRGTEPEPP
jgi:hypothetical protein